MTPDLLIAKSTCAVREVSVPKREWVRCLDPERMIERLWRLGDLSLIGRRPFFAFAIRDEDQVLIVLRAEVDTLPEV